MSIENSAIHYIKDTMFGDFYLNNPLENKPLGRIFCQMVEFKSLENITYLSPTSVFMQDMLEAFEEFDKNLNPPGLITQQFTALAQKCAKKGVKLLIGKDYRNDSIGVVTDKFYKTDKGDKCVFINFSEEMVQEQIKKPFVVIQAQNGKFKVKTMTYEDLFPNCNQEELLKKCAAFLFFHELFHVGSFGICDFEKNKYDELKTQYGYLQQFNIESETLSSLFTIKMTLKNEADDARNTIWKLNETREIPGEFELLNAICNLPTIRLYYGNYLNLPSLKVYSSCLELGQKLLSIEPHNSQAQALENIIHWTLENVGMNLYCKWLTFYVHSPYQISEIKNLMLDIEKKINEKKALLVDFSNMPAINLQYLDNTVKKLKEGLKALSMILENKDINADQQLKLRKFLGNVVWEINKPLTLEQMLNDMQKTLENPKDFSLEKENIESELNLLKEYISLLHIAYNYELKPRALLGK